METSGPAIDATEAACAGVISDSCISTCVKTQAVKCCNKIDAVFEKKKTFFLAYMQRDLYYFHFVYMA